MKIFSSPPKCAIVFGMSCLALAFRFTVRLRHSPLIVLTVEVWKNLPALCEWEPGYDCGGPPLPY